MTNVRLLAVDNDRNFLQLLTLLTAARDHVTITTHESIAEVDTTQPAPDVVLLDLRLGRHDTDTAVRHIPRLVQWCPRILLVTQEDRPAQLQLAVEAGASGVMLKIDGANAVLDAAHRLATTGTFLPSPVVRELLAQPVPHLTDREVEMLALARQGMNQQEVAAATFVTVSTVQTHYRNIRKKFRIDDDRTSLSRCIQLASELGLLPLAAPPSRQF